MMFTKMHHKSYSLPEPQRGSRWKKLALRFSFTNLCLLFHIWTDVIILSLTVELIGSVSISSDVLLISCLYSGITLLGSVLRENFCLVGFCWLNPGILSLYFCHINSIAGSTRPGFQK